MAMVNPMLNIANSANVKDSRWLTLEVCREYQRNKCTRSDTECKFAHPPAHVEVQNGRVTACFDSIKGKCQRKDPPCKYLHPPQHLREQLLQNGRNNLILKNLQMQAQAAALQPQMVPAGLISPIAAATKQHTMAYPTVFPGQIPVMPHPYLAGSVPTSAVQGYNPYISTAMPTIAVQSGTGGDCSVVTQQIPGVISATIPSITSQQKVARADRLEQSAMPGMIPYKRVAVEHSKSGLPMYQPNPAASLAYQQLAAMQQLQQQQQQYIPVTFAGHPPSMPRF